MLKKWNEMLEDLKKKSRGPVIKKRMNDTLDIMKDNLVYLNNPVQYMYEKRIKELEEIIRRKDREIEDIKTQCVEEFERINKLCFVNDCGGKYDAFRKIQEIATDNIYELTMDIVIDREIELTTTPIEISSSK